MFSIGGGNFDCHGSIAEGSEFKMSGRELEIDCSVSRVDYLSGACFGRSVPFSAPQATSSSVSKQFTPLKPRNTGLTPSAYKPLALSAKKGITLVAVDLVSNGSSSAKKENNAVANEKDTHWIAVW